MCCVADWRGTWSLQWSGATRIHFCAINCCVAAASEATVLEQSLLHTKVVNYADPTKIMSVWEENNIHIVLHSLSRLSTFLFLFCFSVYSFVFLFFIFSQYNMAEGGILAISLYKKDDKQVFEWSIKDLEKRAHERKPFKWIFLNEVQ